MNPSFNSKILQSFVPIFNSKTETMLNRLDKEAGNPNFDILPYMNACTLDMVCGKLNISFHTFVWKKIYNRNITNKIFNEMWKIEFYSHNNGLWYRLAWWKLRIFAQHWSVNISTIFFSHRWLFSAIERLFNQKFIVFTFHFHFGWCTGFLTLPPNVSWNFGHIWILCIVGPIYIRKRRNI